MAARYTMTSASVVTMDPDAGRHNAGTYCGMISTMKTISVLLATALVHEGSRGEGD